MNMFSPLALSLKRGGRLITSYLLATGLIMLATWLSGLALPAFLAPVIAAIVAAIGKYIRETLKLRLPF